LTILAALFKAFARVAREWKLQLVLWLANLVLGVLFLAPWVVPVLIRMAHRPVLEREPVLGWMAELGRIVSEGRASPGGVVLAVVGVAILVQSGLVGGVVARVCAWRRFRLADFAAASGKMWGRAWRIELWLAPLLLLVLGVAAGLAFALHALHHDTLFTAPGVLWLLDRPFTPVAWVHLLLVVLGVAFWRATVVLARVRVWTWDTGKTRVAVWHSLRQVLGHPLVVLVYFAIWLLGLAALLKLAAVHARLNTPQLMLLAATFTQVMVWVRGLFHVLHTAFLAEWAGLNETYPSGRL
jgi:hypothetical protein